VTAVQRPTVGGAPDPRPIVVERSNASAGARIVGARCSACAYPVAEPLERCPVCRSACVAAQFGPAGTVFAATVLRVPVPGRTPPYALAYVDLDDGPRVLAHVARTDVALDPGTSVWLTGTTESGDPLVTDERPAAS
jgi:uncharacterized OB-fold protein